MRNAIFFEARVKVSYASNLVARMNPWLFDEIGVSGNDTWYSMGFDQNHCVFIFKRWPDAVRFGLMFDLQPEPLNHMVPA